MVKRRKSKLWYLFKILFPKANLRRVFITFGNTIWLPPDDDITDDLEVHENTHIIQQKSGALRWWFKYVFSKRFRYSQELEAYSNQLSYLKCKLKDRRFNRRFNEIAGIMASSMYGNMCTLEQARSDLYEET